MWNALVVLVSGAGLLACSVPAALPTLSARAWAIVHQPRERTPTSPEVRRLDVAVTLQLSFQTGQRRRAQAPTFNTTPVGLWNESTPCSTAAVCSWANAAEQTALIALGVPP